MDRLQLPRPTFVDVDGVAVATYVLGPAAGEPAASVVLCHGTPWSAAVWAPLAAALRGTYRVHLWDMPGYGASIGDGAAAVDLVTQRRRLAALLAHWGLERPHVLAHDIGGAVALGAHVGEGVDYASLYLLDVVTLDPWGTEFFQLVAQHEEVFGALPLPLHTALVRQYVAGAGSDGALSAARVDELARPWTTTAGRSAFYRQIAQLSPEHTRPIVARLGEVRSRVRIGWGEVDPWIPSAQAGRLASLLPRPTDVVVFPGAGHLVPLEAQEALAADVTAWLES